MKSVLAFDVDQTLNVAKTPIPDNIADLLLACLRAELKICPISGQKFDQFLANLHLFVAQGTQYYRYTSQPKTPSQVKPTPTKSTDAYRAQDWEQVYSYPLTDEQVQKIIHAIETAAKELGYWEEDQLAQGDEIIENRLSQVTFSALGQKAGTKEKYAWDPDHQKREAIVRRAKELAPEFDYEIGGTTSINAITPGMNKVFGMTHLLDELNVKQKDILYFGDMTQPGGNDYPVVKMGIDTITVRSHEDTAFALRGIL